MMTGSVAMKFVLDFCAAIGLAGATSAAIAGENGQADAPCYWCIRDAIYGDVSLINHLEANPDVDEAVKGPQIVSARADIHRLRVLLGPSRGVGADLCCYARPRLYVR
jgi:hypothetical protein